MRSGFRSDQAVAAEFVRVWQSAASAQDVADHFKTTLPAVSSAASALRKKGVPLKKFGGKGSEKRAIDYAALATLAEQEAKQPDEAEPQADAPLDDAELRELESLDNEPS